jgi:steroid delta-isomerase-like uncharacterized protein
LKEGLVSAPATDLGRATADLIDAFNGADWDRMRTHLADDVTYSETGTGRRIEGADAYLELCHGWRDAFPDVAGTITDSAGGDGVAVLEIRWQGTHTGPLMTPAGVLPPSGNRVEADASFWARYDGDRIRELHHHLDVLTLLQQVGALAG